MDSLRELMASLNLHIPSFNSGEISPLLSDRYGVEKVASGCRSLKNFIVHTHGPVFRRPGSLYIDQTFSSAAKTCLKPFVFSTETVFVIGFNPFGLRFWSNGARVPVFPGVACPYNQGQCFQLQTCQVNDVLYIAHPDHPVRRLVRNSDTSWTLEVVNFEWPPMRDENVSGLTLSANGTSGTVALTASAPLFVAQHIGATFEISHYRPLSYVELQVPASAFSETESSSIRVFGSWDVFTYGSWEGTLYLERLGPGGWEVMRSWKSKQDRNIIASGSQDIEETLRLRISDGTGAVASGAASPRFVLELADSKVSGLVTITAWDNPLLAYGVVVKSLYSTDATTTWTEGAFSGARGYPRTVAMHGQRLWFGGTYGEPQRLWGSVINDIQNFRRSSLDDASVSFTPFSNGSNPIQWLASVGDYMAMGTRGDEWLIGGQGKAITPTNVQFARKSSYGSELIPAQLVGEALCFVQKNGLKLRRITPQSDSDAWTSTDLTILAEHVTASGYIVQVAFMQNPTPILWCVTADGRLLGMTHEPEQNVFAWHVHTLGTLVESVCVVPGDVADEVWLVVLRGATRFVELLSPTMFARGNQNQSRQIYLDCAKIIDNGSPTNILTGLGHLTGMVSILADGAEVSERMVSGGGVVTLDEPCTTAVVGYKYTSEIQPSKIQVGVENGVSEAKPFKLSRAGLSLYKSLGGEIADAPEGRFEEINYRNASMATDYPPPLFTGLVDIPLESRTRDNIEVVVRTSSPLPLHLTGMVLKADVYGGK